MNRLPRIFGLGLAIFFVLIAAPVIAQNGAGWKAASVGNSRYDVATKGPAQSAAAAPKGQGQNPGEITPVQGAPVAAAAPGITRAQVTKGTASLPQDKGQVWREYDI